MRGIAILLVLIHHFHIAYRLDQGFFASVLPATLVRDIARNGNYGVTIFFAISGFLITSMSLSRFGELKNVRLGTFYSLRFARIAPNLGLILGTVLSLALIGIPIFENKPETASMGLTVLSVVTFSHNLLMQEFGYFNYCLNVLWSLSVEEMFYFLFPLICMLLRKDVRIIAFGILVVIFAPIHRFHYRDNEFVALYGYLSCFDGIAIGCIAALLKNRLRLSTIARFMSRYTAAAVIVFVYFYRPIMANVVYGISLIALSTGVILVGAQDLDSVGRASTKVVARTVRWLGKNSYELYLFHIVVLALMRTAVKRGALGYYAKPLWFMLFLVLSATLAGCISGFYSEPMNKWLRKLLVKSTVSREIEISATLAGAAAVDPIQRA